jgi:hypothetical protein
LNQRRLSQSSLRGAILREGLLDTFPVILNGHDEQGSPAKFFNRFQVQVSKGDRAVNGSCDFRE